MLRCHDYVLSIALLACVTGCGDAHTARDSGGASPAAQNPGPTANLVDMKGVRHRLPQADADFLAGLVSEKPDVDTTDHIALDPPYRVLVNDVDFALEPHELILMHKGGTRLWKSSGVRERILKAAGISK